jgi:CBS domain-containing protein
MRVKDLMSAPVVCVFAETPVKGIAAILVDRRVSAVPVLDAQDRLIGIVSEADLIPLETADDPRRHLLPWHPSEQFVARRAEEVMTRDVVTLTEEADASEAARLMLQRHIKRIPIASGDRVVGIVSRRDLLRTLARSDGEILAEVEEMLEDETLALGRFLPSVDGGVVTLVGEADRSERRLVELVVRSVPGVLGVRFESQEPVTAGG